MKDQRRIAENQQEKNCVAAVNSTCISFLSISWIVSIPLKRSFATKYAEPFVSPKICNKRLHYLYVCAVCALVCFCVCVFITRFTRLFFVYFSVFIWLVRWCAIWYQSEAERDWIKRKHFVSSSAQIRQNSRQTQTWYYRCFRTFVTPTHNSSFWGQTVRVFQVIYSHRGQKFMLFFSFLYSLWLYNWIIQLRPHAQWARDNSEVYSFFGDMNGENRAQNRNKLKLKANCYISSNNNIK